MTGATMDWLAATRSYVDYTSGRASSSVVRAEFNARCSAEYDSCYSYRFACRLRNYAQHCGIPFHSVQLGERILLLDRDTLLKRSTSWGAAVKADLISGPAQISLLQVVQESMSSLRSISNWVTTQESSDLTEALEFARQFRDHFLTSYEDWFPASSTKAPRDYVVGDSVSFTILPFWVIEIVERIVTQG